MIRDFNSWIEYEGASEGSGRGEKVWLINPEDGVNGMFKYNKALGNTTEHLSEMIASDIAKTLEIGCADIEIGVYSKRIGCMSYQINKSDECIIEGIHLISRYYPGYNPKTLYDEESNQYYSLDMILHSLNDYGFKDDFFKVIIFDFIIGNTDRHQSNWAILKGAGYSKLCPLYDNGSSLCSYIIGDNIDSYLGNDKLRFNSLVNSKSTSRIRIDGNLKKEPTHYAMMQYIYEKYYDKCINFVKKVINILTEERLDDILLNYGDDIIDSNKKLLIKKFLLAKVELLRIAFKL